MGGTVVATSLVDGGLQWVSVGDSLLYLLRDGMLKRLNDDHSMGPQIDLMARNGNDRRGDGPHPSAAQLPDLGADRQGHPRARLPRAAARSGGWRPRRAGQRRAPVRGRGGYRLDPRQGLASGVPRNRHGADRCRHGRGRSGTGQHLGRGDPRLPARSPARGCARADGSPPRGSGGRSGRRLEGSSDARAFRPPQRRNRKADA